MRKDILRGVRLAAAIFAGALIFLIIRRGVLVTPTPAEMPVPQRVERVKPEPLADVVPVPPVQRTPPPAPRTRVAVSSKAAAPPQPKVIVVDSATPPPVPSTELAVAGTIAPPVIHEAPVPGPVAVVSPETQPQENQPAAASPEQPKTGNPASRAVKSVRKFLHLGGSK